MKRNYLANATVKKAITFAMAIMVGFSSITAATLTSNAEEAEVVEDVAPAEETIGTDIIVTEDIVTVEKEAAEKVQEAIQDALESSDGLKGDYPIIDDDVDTILEAEYIKDSEQHVDKVIEAEEKFANQGDKVITPEMQAELDNIDAELVKAQEKIDEINKNAVVTAEMAEQANVAYEDAKAVYDAAAQSLAEAKDRLDALNAAQADAVTDMTAELDAAKADMDKAVAYTEYAEARLVVARNLVAEATKKAAELKDADTIFIRGNADTILDTSVDGKYSNTNKELQSELETIIAASDAESSETAKLIEYKDEINALESSVKELCDTYNYADGVRTKFQAAVNDPAFFSTGAIDDVWSLMTRFNDAKGILLSTVSQGDDSVAKASLIAIEKFQKNAGNVSAQQAAMRELTEALGGVEFTAEEIYLTCRAFNYNLQADECPGEIIQYMDPNGIIGGEFDYSNLDADKMNAEHAFAVNWINTVQLQAKVLLDLKNIGSSAAKATELSAQLSDVLNQESIQDAQKYLEQQSLLALVSVGYQLDMDQLVLTILDQQLTNAERVVASAKADVVVAREALNLLDPATASNAVILKAQKAYEAAKKEYDNQKKQLDELEEIVEEIEKRIPAPAPNPTPGPAPAPATTVTPAAPAATTPVAIADEPVALAAETTPAPARRRVVTAPAAEVVEIADEDTPLAVEEQTAPAVEEVVEEPVVEIADEDTPFAIEKVCYIHLIMLVLAIIAAIYGVIRFFARRNGKERKVLDIAVIAVYSIALVVLLLMRQCSFDVAAFIVGAVVDILNVAAMAFVGQKEEAENK